MEINSRLVEALDNKGLALGELGKHKEAIECFNKSLEINSINGVAWNNKGIILALLEKYEEAIECFDKAIEINPRDENAIGARELALKHLRERFDSKNQKSIFRKEAEGERQSQLRL